MKRGEKRIKREIKCKKTYKTNKNKQAISLQKKKYYNMITT